jgi:hypothetical protein
VKCTIRVLLLLQVLRDGDARFGVLANDHSRRTCAWTRAVRSSPEIDIREIVSSMKQSQPDFLSLCSASKSNNHLSFFNPNTTLSTAMKCMYLVLTLALAAVTAAQSQCKPQADAIPTCAVSVLCSAYLFKILNVGCSCHALHLPVPRLAAL